MFSVGLEAEPSAFLQPGEGWQNSGVRAIAKLGVRLLELQANNPMAHRSRHSQLPKETP